MLNCYPLWKYLMLIFVILLSFLYALPNFYGEDPAVQITGVRGNAASELILNQVHDILKKNHLTSQSMALKNGTILVRFKDPNVQLAARDILISILGDSYVVALNLAPATPTWLRALGADPMKLGLDLRGGVHFLMEVDMDAIISKLQIQNMDSLRKELQEKNITYTQITKQNSTHDYGIVIDFSDAKSRDEAVSYLSSRQKHMLINADRGNKLKALMTVDRLREVREYAIQQNMTILRNRVNQIGVAESLVQRQGDRIVVELPGIQDTARAKEILGATASLEFHLVNTKVTSEAVEIGIVPADTEIKKDRDGRLVALYKKVIMTGDHITDAFFGIDEYNQPQVNISLDSLGSTVMADFTKDNIGKLMASLYVEYKDSGNKDINGRPILVKQEEVINTANISSRFGGRFQITGIGTPLEARQLALLLRAGALIAPIQIVKERTIGPTLGAQNISQGLDACLAGLVASILFMVVYYRKFGVIASTALLANLVLIVGVMSLLPGVTLTMPGIAGIVLTLAVAVDANVLINERIKEDLRNARSIQQAIHQGYKGAFSSIIDANITTLITAVILYAVGTGSIKGFAITTIIGVLTSMFTAILGTRAIVNMLYGGKRIDKLSI
ncbi:protein translocase subunit SecD [Candidatus Williamhamiltonella defendens]|uniref:protein translocase subunit SecD n=1 Tax=Candidatus Williamhamiltonella defendens TaxID=138072 RepID=UPI00130E5F13|nr:protein translocase subunit SecD [Candidatus Hamiltonella defensa]